MINTKKLIKKLEEIDCFSTKQYKIKKINNCYKLDITDTKTSEKLSLYSDGCDYVNMKEFIRSFIHYLYKTEITKKKRYITFYRKGLLNRRMKTLTKAMQNNDIVTVLQINKEMTEKFTTIEQYQADIDKLMFTVCDLYHCIDELCPQERDY